jgi:hypothetical protein
MRKMIWRSKSNIWRLSCRIFTKSFLRKINLLRISFRTLFLISTYKSHALSILISHKY